MPLLGIEPRLKMYKSQHKLTYIYLPKRTLYFVQEL